MTESANEWTVASGWGCPIRQLLEDTVVKSIRLGNIDAGTRFHARVTPNMWERLLEQLSGSRRVDLVKVGESVHMLVPICGRVAQVSVCPSEIGEDLVFREEPLL